MHLSIVKVHVYLQLEQRLPSRSFSERNSAILIFPDDNSLPISAFLGQSFNLEQENLHQICMLMKY